MPASFQGRRPTVPEYYRDFINSKVDLRSEPKQCCPFHKEDTPSFSYKADGDVWRCFGGCKVGGNVVKLHQVNYKLRSMKEAEESLNRLYGVKVEMRPISTVIVNEDRIENEVLFQKLNLLANTVDRWLELDYIMSKYPTDYSELRALYNKWTSLI